MAAVSLTDYTSQIAELQRRQKLADALSEQGNADIPIQSYNGIQAPIPWTAVLAKALNSGLGAYQDRKASDDAAALRKSMAQGYASDTADQPVASTAPVQPQMPQQPMRNDDYAAAAAMGPPPSPAGPNPQAIAAALQSDPTAAPQPQGPPPQAVAAALNGPAPPQAAMPAPVPQGAPVAAPALAAMPVAPAQPAPTAAPPVNPALAQAQAAVQQARQIALKYVGTPYAADAQARVTAAQEQVKKIADLQDAAAQKQQEVIQDRQDATKLVGALNLPQDVQALLLPVAQYGGMRALTPALTKIEDNKLGPHDTYMPPQEVAAKGFNPGSIVTVNSVTGEPKVIFDPTPTKQANQRIALEAKSVAIAGGNLALRRAEFSRDALAPPTTIEHIVNGEPVQTTAMFDKRNGRYIDMQGKPVDPTGLRVMPAGGSRATLGLLRVSTAAADAATGIENLSKLPAGSQGAWFSQAANTPMGALKRVLTPQEAQDIRTTGAGLSRAMAGLATGGLSADIPTQQSFDALLPQAGQTRLTALRQMGEMRQQAENGIESALANPYITPAQKANLTAAKTKIANAVPWTPTDVSNLENSRNPNATMHGMGLKTLPTANHNAGLMSAADAALARLGIH